MPRPIQIQTILEETVAELFEAALPRLQQEIVRRAVEEVESALIPAPGSSPTELLNAALASIQNSISQSEILRHLLEAIARFASRAALFVVRGGSVTGWQSIGFQDNDSIKQLNLNPANGLVAKAIQGKSPAQGLAQEFDSGFEPGPNAPVDGNCVVLPLVVKEKVAAVIYADAGVVADNPMDIAALNIICRFSALWLETAAVRKAGGAGAVAQEESATQAPAVVSGRDAERLGRFRLCVNATIEGIFHPHFRALSDFNLIGSNHFNRSYSLGANQLDGNAVAVVFLEKESETRFAFRWM